MIFVLHLLFVLSLLVCLWVYFGYPAFMWGIARLRPRPVRKGDARPTVTIILPVYNEQGILDRKIENTLALDSPGGGVEILVASDGSTDRTAEIARRHAARGVRLLDLPRRGKNAALNAAMREATGEILVFSDANAILRSDALLRIVENFADPEVGGVCGNQGHAPVAAGADSTGEGERMYWSYDRWLKLQESRTGSCFASDGALHAVRRELVGPIPDDGGADDIRISTQVILRGRRLVFEPLAVATEEAPGRGAQEFRRKVRVTVHSLLACLCLGGALFDRGLWSLEILSHKVVRHLVPFFLILLLVTNALLAPTGWPWTLLLLGQAAFYLLALAGLLFRGTPAGRALPLRTPYFFVLANAAALVGCLRLLLGDRMLTWVPRTGEDGGLR